MVNAFSGTRAPRSDGTVDLNKMVTEVSDLSRAGAIRGVRLKVELDPRIDALIADPAACDNCSTTC
jgi:hypothetical protein